MTSHVNVKVCGVRRQADIDACASAGARYVGFNFFPKSPRFVAFEAAAALAAQTPSGICKVGLVVSASDAELDALTGAVPLDMLQLHGKEDPTRVAQIKARYGLPVMKAVGVADASDLPALNAFAQVADQILVDAKAPKDAVLPGGNGLAFDWRLIAGRHWTGPWMLAGGLTSDSVPEAVSLTGAMQVDVASGVETAPGVKDADLIVAFCKAAGV